MEHAELGNCIKMCLSQLQVCQKHIFVTLTLDWSWHFELKVVLHNMGHGELGNCIRICLSQLQVCQKHILLH